MKRFAVWVGLMLAVVVGGSFCLAGNPGVTIRSGEGAQFEITSPAGVRVFIDVCDPSAIVKPVSQDDILLTTHGHPDHVNRSFLDSFPGTQLYVRTGAIQRGDVSIHGIAASHDSSNDFIPEGGSDYIFLIETAGFRIAHFGDIGQDQLTPEQLNQLGEVDLALMQLSNSYSGMSLDNKKGFILMGQVQPKLLIPTHFDEPAAQYAVTQWPGVYAAQSEIKVGKIDFSGSSRQGSVAKTKILFMGVLGKYYGKTLKLPKYTTKVK